MDRESKTGERFQWRDAVPLLKETFKAWQEDKVPRLAAALAYYTVFSIAPLTMLVIAIAGLYFGKDAVAGKLEPQLAHVMGAKAAGVGATIALMLADCEPLEVGRRVAKGLQAFRATCRERGGEFAALPVATREALLRELDAAAVAAREGHWFSDVRRLALDAYFSSEIGLTRAMRYVPIPGRYDGCVPLAPGQPAWG